MIVNGSSGDQIMSMAAEDGMNESSEVGDSGQVVNSETPAGSTPNLGSQDFLANDSFQANRKISNEILKGVCSALVCVVAFWFFIELCF